MLDKEYVLRMPSYMSFNELHEKQKEGFLFDGEVSAMKVEFLFLFLALILQSCTPPPARMTLTLNTTHHTPYTKHYTLTNSNRGSGSPGAKTRLSGSLSSKRWTPSITRRRSPTVRARVYACSVF